MKFKDLREFIRFLEDKGELRRITAPVNHELEITEITDRVIKSGGPALLFENVTGFDTPVLVNMYGTEQRTAWALGVESLDALTGRVEGLLREWTSEAALREVGVSPTRSLLIYGPPGSGKTITAHYIAVRLGLPLVVARIDGLISSFLGTTARNIANLFDFANRYACVLLLDEFDALAKLRDDPQEIGEIKRVVNTLLQNLDQRRNFGITIAITNHDRLLDPAVWRRFETHLQLGEPDEAARESLIARFLQPLEPPASTLRVFSYCLAGCTGADIERVCTAVKRTLALSGESHDGPGLFHALSSVLARAPQHDHVAARILAVDQEAFVSLIANDGTLSLKQTEIGEATGYGQSRVSDLKKAKRHLPLLEASHAQ